MRDPRGVSVCMCVYVCVCVCGWFFAMMRRNACGISGHRAGKYGKFIPPGASTCACLYVRSCMCECVCVWWEVLRHDEQSQEKYFDTWRFYLGVDRGHFHIVFFKLL